MPIIPTPPIQGSPPPIRSAVLRDFTGGLNFRDNASQLAANELSDEVNCDIGGQGGVSRRGSFRPLGASGITTANSPQFLFHIPDDTSNGYVLMGAQSATGPTDKLSYWTTITEGTAPAATRSFATASNDDEYWSGALMKPTEAPGDQYLYIHRDYLAKVQAFQTSDNLLHSEMTDAYGNYNENFAAPGSGCMPKASIMAAHRDYMFHADCYENSLRRTARLRWSHPGHPGDYRANDFIDVGEGQDNDRISALVSNGSSLFVFKERSVWVLEGYSADTFSITRVASGIGCGNHNAAAYSQYGVTFFDRNLGMHQITFERVAGVRMWHANCLWLKLNAAITDGRITNTRQACVTWVGSKLYVSGLIEGGAAHANRTYMTDMQVGPGWVRYNVGFVNIGCYKPFGSPPLFMGIAPFDGSQSGATNYDRLVIQGLNATLTDLLDGTHEQSYVSYFQTSWITGGDASLKKRFRRFSMVFGNLATGHGFTVNSFKNWSFAADRTYTVDGDYVSGTAEQKNVRGGTVGTGYAVALKVTGPNDRAWNVDQLTLRFIPQRIV